MRVAKTIAAWFVASGLTFVLVRSDSPIAVVGPAAAQERERRRRNFPSSSSKIS